MSDQETLRERLDKVTCPLCQQGVPFLDDQPSIIHKDGNGNLIGCRSQAAAILPIVQAELAALREQVVRECGRHALFLRYEADHGGARDYLLAREEEARYIESVARALLAEEGK